jgi:membrane peptidoglycan carboxypeptidase
MPDEPALDETALPAAPPPRSASGEPARASVHPRPTRHTPPSAGANASNDGQISAGYQTAQVGFGAGAGVTTPLNGSGYAPIGTSANFRRRRRRYMLYVRRSARARQTARSLGAARAAMAVAVAIAALVTVVTSGAVSAAAGYYQVRAADIAALNRTVAAKDSVRVYDANGVLLYEFADAGVQHSVPLAKIPVSVINATIAIEDHSFWDNQGVDFNSIVRAAYTNVVQHGISQGGSTITQQLIKQNVLNSNESFERKIKEAILAYGMTTQGVFSKRQIIEMYLNSIPYGQEAYGIDAAARAYFGYTDDSDSGVSAAQHLDLAQSAMLAGIPQNPNLNNPLLHPQHAHDRQVEVLRNMVEQGYITQKQADQAATESLKPGFFKPQPAPKNLAPHFVNFIRDQLEQMVETGQLRNLSRSGLNVYTTLDLDLQNHVQDAIKQHLYGDDRDDYVGHHFIRDDHLTNSAAIIADHHTGAIKVMLGSVDYYSDKIDGQFNVATQGYRGPGSSFKPIVYATAFSKGWFPAMTVSDMPTVFWDEGQNRVYKPLNFNIDQFEGNITLRKALQWSLNIPAVKVMQYAGIDDVERNAMRMGIRKWQGQWGLSSVLGSLDVTLYDMTQAYTVFANEGKYIPMYSIDHITDGASNVLFQYHAPLPVQVLSPQVAYMVTSVLSDNPARAGDFGTCSPLYLDPSKDDCLAHNGDSPNAWPAAAKTGTGQDFRDDWTLGYTMDYTMGVWAGNNDHTPMVRIDGITGAAPTWYRSLIYAEQNLPKRAFPVPDGMQRATYTSNGVTSTDWFLAGPLPPPNIGNSGPTVVPCIVYHDDPNNPWDYC